MRSATSGSRHQGLTVIGAAGLGMLAMYLFDPQAGRRRRAIATDKLYSTRLRMEHMADLASRDGANRGRGLWADLRARFSAGEHVQGHKLEERVRSRIGRAVANPHAIRVRADEDGTVTLSGPVLASEVPKLMRTTWAVRGVKKIESALDVHESPGNVSALQGAKVARRQWQTVDAWSPSVRMLAGGAGLAAAAMGVARGRALGLVGALAGGALLARSVTNHRLADLAARPGTHSIHIDKDMFIAAPPEQVFDFWCRQEDFPRFMRNVEEVRPMGENRWHWRVTGPLQASVEWDAEIVEREENRRLVWRSLPGASVESEGRVEFQPEGDGTRLHVSMSYSPTAGAMGHMFARLFGRDAKTEMDEDLTRVKSFLETGMPPRDAQPGQSLGGSEQASRLH